MKNFILISAFLLTACSQTAPNKPVAVAPPADNQIMCPQDAKQCADGTWVGRSGPNCEFVCGGGKNPAVNDEPANCTKEMVACPDGTLAPRGGPHCDPLCPQITGGIEGSPPQK